MKPDLQTSNLPMAGRAAPAYVLSLVIALFLGLGSLASLLFQSAFYPSEALRRAFVSNDVVNLLIGLPILLGAMALARRGRLVGLLFWPGALYYVTYNYLAYAIAMPLTGPFWFYLAMVTLSVYAIIRLLAGVDAQVVGQRLRGAVPERLAGGILAGFGILFFALQVSKIAQGLTGQAALSGSDLALAITDVILIPTWVAGGVMLWRKQPLGYLAGGGLLFQASMLFVGLLVFFLLQPLVAGVPFPAGDFVVILVMGSICFVPFGLFLRGVLRERGHTTAGGTGQQNKI